MIEAAQLPILLKAIDFVFEEGRKILEERRERRKADETSQDSKDQEPAKEETPLPEAQESNEVKEDLVTSKIDEILWQNHEDDVRHLVKLLETYSRNYRHTHEQYAKWGSDLVPPVIVHRLTEHENSMLETIKRLEVVLSKVYKKDINIVEDPKV